ncbi:MAG: nucleotidyl transferase AbiEii/AbiGii toxin family protein, partial [Lachnospiraceae bacterium]|nr:nucleotidyl transferase AbiEii/AbiGii toxin family protein [Lachnospiraceae bacterium]
SVLKARGILEKTYLFSGKLHAVIGRSWKNRVKGRDLYDYIFYLSKGTKVNLRHLRERLIQSGHIETEQDFFLDDMKHMLHDRFEQIDFQQAKEDVAPFVRDSLALNLWNKDFFQQITENIQAI